jgi:hypothetical protein
MLLCTFGVGMFALVGMLFLVGFGRAMRAGDRRALNRAVGALIGQSVLVVILGVPLAMALSHYAGGTFNLEHALAAVA